MTESKAGIGIATLLSSIGQRPGDFNLLGVPDYGHYREQTLNYNITPEALSSIHSTIWGKRLSRLQQWGVDVDISMHPCTYTQQEIDELTAHQRRIGLKMTHVAPKETPYLLPLFFPRSGREHGEELIHSQEKNVRALNAELNRRVFGKQIYLDWVDYDITPTTAEPEKGRKLMDFVDYQLFSQDNYLLTNHFFDEPRIDTPNTLTVTSEGIHCFYYPNGELWKGNGEQILRVYPMKVENAGIRTVGRPKKGQPFLPWLN